MANAETNLMTRILLRLSSLPDQTWWRQNTGKLWGGNRVSIPSGSVFKVTPDVVILQHARPVDAGLCKGSGDLIGIRTIEITPDMVGKKIAVFQSCEVKTDSGRATDDQKRFMSHINNAGGRACISRSPDDAVEFFTNTS